MCNSEIERRQAWRESDGFAKAVDGVKVAPDPHWEERLKQSVRMDTASGDINPLKMATVRVGRSPLFISVALGFHTQLDYQPVPFAAQKEICEEMVRLGLLREDPVVGASHMHYVPVQEALSLYVEALCSVPLPRKRWVMP